MKRFLFPVQSVQVMSEYTLLYTHAHVICHYDLGMYKLWWFPPFCMLAWRAWVDVLTQCAEVELLDAGMSDKNSFEWTDVEVYICMQATHNELDHLRLTVI